MLRSSVDLIDFNVIGGLSQAAFHCFLKSQALREIRSFNTFKTTSKVRLLTKLDLHNSQF